MPERVHWLRSRLQHLWKISRFWWFVMYEVIWAVLINLDGLVNFLGWEWLKRLWERWSHPHWSWKTWVIGALVIVILSLVEGSYRVHRKSQEAAENHQQVLATQLSEEIAKRPRPALALTFISVGGGEHRTLWILRLTNSSDSPAVGIRIADINYQGKTLRFFPPPSVASHGFESIECRVVEESGDWAHNNIAALFGSDFILEMIKRAAKENRTISDNLPVQVRFSNLDTKVHQCTWLLSCEIWFDYMQERPFLTTPTVELLNAQAAS